MADTTGFITDLTVSDYANIINVVRSGTTETDSLKRWNNPVIVLGDSIIPDTDNTYTIGDIDNQLNNLTTHNATVDNTANINVLTIDLMKFRDEISANIRYTGNLVPTEDDVYSVGFPDKRWKRMVITDLNVAGTINAMNAELIDNTTIIRDNIDPTKRFRFQAENISTTSLREYIVPDADTTLVGTDVTQTITNKNITGSTNTIGATELNTTGAAVAISTSAPPGTDYVLLTTSPTSAEWVLSTDVESAIVVQDEGIGIANSPHYTLNFNGDIVTVTDAGSGRANVNVTLPTTTKGDLMVHNGTIDVRQDVGPDNYILTANSLTSTGVEWTDPNSAIMGLSVRDIQGVSVEDLAGSITLTAQNVDTPIADMILTTSNGGMADYIVIFSAFISASNSSNSVRIETKIAIDGVVRTVTMRKQRPGSSAEGLWSTQHYVAGVSDGIDVQVYWRKTGGGTFTLFNRELIILGLN